MEEETVEYLAIGSMMNKTSINMRGIFPQESRAACLKGYELFFGMANGFAAAKPKQGGELHGVVHRISKKELAILDKIEVWYIRDLVEVVPYYGENKQPAVKAFVYVFDPAKVEKNPSQFAANPPKERYMDILLEGAKYFGLENTFIENNLSSVEFVARKELKDLRVFDPPEEALPEWTVGEMQEKDRANEDIVFLALKTKVIRFDLNGVTEHTPILKRDRGTQWAHLIASKYMYDPKFGVPAKVEDMTDDHHRYVEDMVLDSLIIGEVNNRWIVVASLKI
eukprot:TRINITY_DN14957_c0_g1_i1.p1 TRINITY_DN14957_c0_g1~~TRINITY_DN14957_c0_g1_i1.p1  ORF type:complete len:288 (+),score=82.83 TRINITY_DN14957_c0_g1_i1:23-865(+)